MCARCGVPPARIVRRAESWLDDVPGTYEVRECASCGLWVTSPRPRRDELRRVYPAGYHKVRTPDPAPARTVRGEQTVLDVGCGVGDFLAIARSRGWRGVGVEISPEAAAVARARGFDVVVGDALDVEFPGEKFDRVRCAHTLEHVPDPSRLVRRLADAVRDDGLVTIVVPNRESVTARLFRRYWYHLDLPRHLYHFRPQDIRALAAESGLGVTVAHHTASPSGLLGSVDCVVASLAGRPRTKLRSDPRLRSIVRFIAWGVARLGRADVVEYTLVPIGRRSTGDVPG